MENIKIGVSKQRDGYTFSISPTIREFIRRIFPNSHPANRIFVAYDSEDFESYSQKLETYIFPALLGVDKQDDLKGIGEINFIDNQTDALLFKIKP